MMLEAIQFFIQDAYKHPIWIVASALFITSFGFVISYQASIPEEQARLETAKIEAQIAIEDYQRMLSLDAEILAARKSGLSILTRRSQILPMADAPPSDAKDFEQNCYRIPESIEQLDVAVAKLHGTSFRLPVLNDGMRAREAGLLNLISTLKLLEEFCSPYLKKEMTLYYETINQNQDRMKRLVDDSFSSTAQLESWSFQHAAVLESKRIEAVRISNQTNWLRTKFLMESAAIFFCVGYIACVFLGIRHSATKQRMTTNKSKTGKKRRKQTKVHITK